MARVLVACEFSGIVRDAFQARGHDAMSCDYLPTERPGPHHTGDVLALLGEPWDLVIAHPPCTYLANSGARWLFEKPGRWGHLFEGVRFFRRFLECGAERVAVENPWPHKWAVEMIGRKPDQRAQPWWFGDRQKKGLCLWLKGLPPLLPDQIVGPPPKAGTKEAKEWEGVWREPPGPHQARNRSRTFPGFARAMAAQWGPLLPGDTPCA